MGCSASTLRHRQLQPTASRTSTCGPSAPHNHFNHFDISPLAFAAWRGDAARVAALLEQPAARQELHLRDKEGWSVLHFAVRGGSPISIRLLAQAGADVHAAVPGGQQAIHWAAAAASADCCAELLLAGALPSAPDSAGRTAVQMAQRRLQHELFAEQQAPCQRPASVLAEARKVLALLQAAAGGQLPLGGSSGSPATETAPPPPPASDSAPETPQLGSRVASCRTLDDTASIAGSSAADGSLSRHSGGGSEGQPGDASDGQVQPADTVQASPGGSSGGGSPARRECRVCLQEGQELLALIPCGHRVTCQCCTARLLLPSLMASLAAAAADGAAAGGSGGSSAAKEACRCPVCRAEVTGSLRVFDC